jgi:hypothetical protein
MRSARERSTMRSSGIFHNEKKGLGTIFASSARGGSVAWIGMTEGTTPMLNAQASRPPPRQYSPRRVHHIDCMTQYGSALRINPSCSSPRECWKKQIPLAAQWRKPSVWSFPFAMRLLQLTFCLWRNILSGMQGQLEVIETPGHLQSWLYLALLVPDRLFSGPLCGHL